MYRKLKSDIYTLKGIHDPTVGQPKKRIVEKAYNCIVVKTSEVSQLVDSAYYDTKGEGAKKLSTQMSQIYRGLSRRILQHGLNSVKHQQKVRPLFKIGAPTANFGIKSTRKTSSGSCQHD